MNSSKTESGETVTLPVLVLTGRGGELLGWPLGSHRLRLDAFCGKYKMRLHFLILEGVAGLLASWGCEVSDQGPVVSEMSANNAGGL